MQVSAGYLLMTNHVATLDEGSNLEEPIGSDKRIRDEGFTVGP